jgi:hypothetical protein
MKLILLAITFLTLTAFAKKNHEHRQHEAHVHGSATLNIAFDQLNGKIEFKAASAGVLGFEHSAKSDKDKKTLNDAVAKFETDISKMIQFDSKFGCTFSKEKIEMAKEPEEEHAKEVAAEKKSVKLHKADKHEGEHSDFIANYNVTCLKSIAGSKLTVDFTTFKNIKDLDVTVLADTLQKSFEVKTKPVTIELN